MRFLLVILGLSFFISSLYSTDVKEKKNHDIYTLETDLQQKLTISDPPKNKRSTPFRKLSFSKSDDKRACFSSLDEKMKAKSHGEKISDEKNKKQYSPIVDLFNHHHKQFSLDDKTDTSMTIETYIKPESWRPNLMPPLKMDPSEVSEFVDNFLIDFMENIMCCMAISDWNFEYPGIGAMFATLKKKIIEAGVSNVDSLINQLISDINQARLDNELEKANAEIRKERFLARRVAEALEETDDEAEDCTEVESREQPKDSDRGSESAQTEQNHNNEVGVFSEDEDEENNESYKTP